jgi:hypothetical protein
LRFHEPPLCFSKSSHTAKLASELFNLANHANFGLPNSTVFASDGSYVGNAGAIQDLATASRQIQFSLHCTF